MKNFSNTYIYIFASVMVMIVAIVLVVISTMLKPSQQRNVRLEQMQSILNAVNIDCSAKDAEKKFSKYIVDSYVISPDGNILKNVKAIEVNMKEEYTKIQGIKALKDNLGVSKMSPFKNFMSSFIKFKKVNQDKINRKIKEIRKKRELPVYVCKKDTSTYYIFPLRGKGLWGPIWGYISLKDDFNTIYGANFDHKTETPGLGAEIKEIWFESQFKGKTIYKDNKFASIKVVKGGTSKDNPYGVDAISGATITSKGLQAMLYDCLSSYTEFFNLKRQHNE